MRRPLAMELLNYARKQNKLPELLEATDRIGNTVLHHAAQYKQFDLVHLLLQSGANHLAKRTDRLTPMHLIADGMEHFFDPSV